MIAIPLLILSLAAGIFLLMKASREYMSGFFKVLSWLVIGLSLLALIGMGLHGLHHFRHIHMRGHFDGGMHRGRQVIIKEFNNEMGKDSVCPMTCCKMEGDSMVMDKAMCEKMMGKEACEKMCHERGRCIMSKDECSKMCGGNMSCCSDGKPSCCAGHNAPACCAGKGAEEAGKMKDCCKKK